MGVKISVRELKVKMKFFFAVFVAATSALEMTPDALAAMGILSDSTFMEWAASEIGSDAVTSDGVDLAALLGGSAAADATADVAADATVVAAVDIAADAASDAASSAVSLAALEACTQAQTELNAGYFGFESFGSESSGLESILLKIACDEACADIEGENCVSVAALEACTQAQDDLNASDDFFEKLDLQAKCESACADIEGETCGFLVNGVSFALVALLAFLRN